MTPKKTDSSTPVLEPEPAPAPTQPNPTVPPQTSMVRNGADVPARAPVHLGILPTTVEEGLRLARYMAASSLVPKNFQNKPEDVLVCIQMGIEVGMAPMAALQSICVINGRPSLWGDGFLALIMCSPLYEDHDEYFEVDGQRRDGLDPGDFSKPTTAAVCTFIRRRKVQPVTRRFTVAQAKKAGLLGKQGPWSEYPDRMLQMRARSLAGRDCFPDLMRGMRQAEEAIDQPETTYNEPITVAPVVQRRSEITTTTHAPVPVTETKTVQTPSPLVDVGPVQVKDVVDFLGGFTVTLGNGQQVDTIEKADALDLEKFKGRPDKLVLTCTPIGETLQLVSFRIAD